VADPLANSAHLDVLKALGDNTRYAIYLELARAARPLTTADIADSLGLHANTVRPHLERMRDVGLVDVETEARGKLGRPQHRYSMSPGAPSLGLEPPTMPMLARMVLRLADRLRAGADDAEDVGPIVTDGDDDDTAIVAFAHCPFADIAAEHPELVCGLHRGLVAGFVARMGDAEVREFCTLVDRTPCQVAVRSR
jgi:predicted ArsR family transcriptional regulator